MIGFIAGAGIIVRNSIILVDFIELRRAQGSPGRSRRGCGRSALPPHAADRSRVVVGASVILFDPIFQGLALSLMAGEVASTVLSRMAVPVLYYMSERRSQTKPGTAESQLQEAQVCGGTRASIDGGNVHPAFPGFGTLAQSLLVSFTGFVGLNLLQRE